MQNLGKKGGRPKAHDNVLHKDITKGEGGIPRIAAPFEALIV